MLDDIKVVYLQSNILGGVDLIKTFFIVFGVYFTNLKLMNKGIKLNIKSVLKILALLITTLLSVILKTETNYLISIVFSIFAMSFIYDSKEIASSLTATVISYAINYSILIFSIVLSYILLVITNINNDNINIVIIMLVYLILLYGFSKIKRFTYGISFLRKKLMSNRENENIDIIVLNISIIILCIIAMFPNYNVELEGSLMIVLIILAIIMAINIGKLINLYYKQKLMIKELEETKQELKDKKNEVKTLEEEILSYSKKAHSLAHKQKSLEHKLNQLMQNSEMANELNIEEQVKNISKELYTKVNGIELAKTDIVEIDDMLNLMQSECDKYEIDFNVQIIGNIYYMINNLISKKDLEILIADNLKNAIIAINHTDNVNKSILIKLGKIDEYYGMCIYDSGIEFEKETLESLGKKPITTHADEGGTGMGFMNTFDIMNKTKATLIINEIGKPCKENFTKSVMIKFDQKNEYNIVSYKK